MKAFDEIYEFSRAQDGNGTHPHSECTATAAELAVFIRVVMGLPEWAKVVEIGTYTGRSTSVYLQVAEALHLDIHLIDCLYWNPEHASTTFWKMIVTHFNTIPFTYHKMTTDALYWEDGIDFLYIDGWHLSPEVNRDFAKWTPFVKPGGILAVHDSDMPDVIACLDKYVTPDRFQLVSHAERMTIWERLC